LKIMKRVEEIKQRRNKDLWEARMRRAQVQQVKDAAHHLKHNIDWIEDVEVKEKAKEDLTAAQTLQAERKAQKRERLKTQRRKQRERQAEGEQ
jgi:large subunit ribosomal protein L24e